MNKGFLALLFLLCPFLLLAQKENNVWAFGSKLGIDFNTTPLTYFSTAINPGESSASICDASGKLLFYTDGEQVWDNTHTVMPNGSGIMGNHSSTMGQVFVAIPEKPGMYFLFTVDAVQWAPEMPLRYSLIDLSLNGGKGDIVPGVKNIKLRAHTSERITVASGCKSVWVVTHHTDSAIFYAYKITGTTIPPPVVSVTAGMGGTGSWAYSSGEMRFSPDFKRIAMGDHTNALSLLEVLDFDNQTGVFSGYNVADSSLRYIYNIEFSPDGSKLYAYSFLTYQFFQYDLGLLPDIAMVRATKYDMGFTINGMRRAPDGRIYLSRRDDGYYARINKPNVAGAGCDVALTPAGLGAIANVNFGTRTEIASSSLSLSTSYKDTLVCERTKVSYRTDPAREFSGWNDGDTARSRVFTIPGKYWATYVSADCHTTVDTFHIKTYPRTLTTRNIDTTICFLPQARLRSTATAEQYLWNDGSQDRESTITATGKSWVLSYDEDNGCLGHVDSFAVHLVDYTIGLADTGICPGEKILLDAGPGSVATYLWQDGSADSTFVIDAPGEYEVSVSVRGCTKTKTVSVYARKLPLDLGADKILCEGERIILLTETGFDTYLWQDGSTERELRVWQDGIYSVYITKGACIARDTVTVSFVQCTHCLGIPNAFTPNGDSRNDAFKPIFNCTLRSYEMKIFNRYGQEVFRTQNISEAWDGTFLGRPLDVGVYFFLIRIKLDIPRTEEEIYKGDISLIR